MSNLCWHSQVLVDMFETGKEDPHEGRSNQHLIEIPDLSASTFDLFIEHHPRLWVLLSVTVNNYWPICSPHTGYKYTKEELISFLKFCDRYEWDVTKEFIVNRINVLASWKFNSMELMALAITYQVPSLFWITFWALTKISLTQLTKAQWTLIGPAIFINVALAKSALDKHCWIIAAEVPHILSHTDDCQDPSACKVDRHQVWWNGMGHYLLNGAIPNHMMKPSDVSSWRCTLGTWAWVAGTRCSDCWMVVVHSSMLSASLTNSVTTSSKNYVSDCYHTSTVLYVVTRPA